MAGDEDREKYLQAFFSAFVWQCDLTSDISAAEAEALFRFVENAEVSGLPADIAAEFQKSYGKMWREYLRTGPARPEQLNQQLHHLELRTRPVLVSMLQSLQAAQSGKKRRTQEKLHGALMQLAKGDDAALETLQQIYRTCRYYQEPQPEPELVLEEAPPYIRETQVSVVETVSGATSTVTETITETIMPVARAAENRLPAVHQMVPWSEHDAVTPDRLQFWTKGTRLMRCIGVIERSHDFKSFQFVSDEPTLFLFKPGQFVTLELNIDGKRYLRSYTISSSPSRPHLLEISVKRVKDGLVSNYLHDHLNIGDSLLMKPPGGKFHCFDTVSDKYLFLAAGSGVTPMLSMARWWHDTGAQPDVIFFHSIREPEDAVFTEDMVTFTSANRKFRYVASFTSKTLPETWPGMKGRFSEEKLMQIAPDFKERMVFTCGPDSFMRTVKLILETNGFSLKEKFRQESFGVPKEKKAAEPTPITVFENKPAAAAAAVRATPKQSLVQPGDAVVHFSLSALEVFGGDMDVPILDLAEEVGLEIPSSCRAGTCGTCRALKIKGDVECDDSPALTDADREAGYILTCVSRAKNFVELEI